MNNHSNNRIAWFVVLLLIVGGGSLSVVSFAQDDAKKNDEAQNPVPIKLLTIDAGYMANFSGDEENHLYYKLDYKGQPLTEKGTPFTFVDLNKPEDKIAKPDASNPGGDTSKYSMRLEGGAGALEGGIFDLLGVKEFSPGGFLGRLRGAAQLTGGFDGEGPNLALGLESPPFHPLSQINRSTKAGITNWLIFGLVGDMRGGSQNGGTDDRSGDTGLATYRVFIGRGFNWVRSQRFVDVLTEDVLQRAPTYADAVAVRKEVRKAIADSQLVPSPIETVISQVAADPEPAADYYRAQVEKFVSGFNAPKDQPTSAIWIEGAGWYTLLGDKLNDKRFNNMLAVTWTYWLNPSEDASRWVRLCYEVGRDRAAPTERKDFLALMLGMEY